ncbi:SDR family oxidoreductase [Pseudenhygromyxa sp. WMMC2535]|uniref:SDR family oxidoreductase n=1 Tax=Pseudenhygromyxa sp. WMMC2535 TaxID=2712867 RepID=UPI00155168BE|nr:SDR family oxidoreductase [Pseudenhygromyxa sp. WMMC2535]NVB40419.1 SDR family oxidoreductase [Pseudenhygromyxa sp. WMMC2535]
MKTKPTLAFVTGSTGLLGSNLVRALVAQGIRVRALARSADKARAQFEGLEGVEVVVGDMLNIGGFEAALKGTDVLFHTAAYFRESFQGGSHWAQLERVNVQGTRELLEAAHRQGIRRFVHTSSTAVLDGPPRSTIDETMARQEPVESDYYRSKLYSDREVEAFLDRHPEVDGCFVLPAWMHGPGDAGPTAAGQFTLDFMHGDLAGIPPTTFAFVDARDVAEAMIAAATKGRRGERYLAAGRHVDAATLLQIYTRATGREGPKRKIPVPVVYVIATLSEAYAWLTGRPVLLSMATVRTVRGEAERTRFDSSKSERELGVRFRPMEETIRDEVAWFGERGLIKADAGELARAS